MNEAYRNARFVFEEVIWLLLFGSLPTQEQLDAAAASYSGSSYGDNFIHQTALQTAVMEWLKAHVVVS